MAFITWSGIVGQTTLSGALADTTGTVVTTAASGVANLFGNRIKEGEATYFAVDDEIFQVVAINSATSITVIRGALGTTAATHSDAAPVHLLSLAALVKLIKAVAVAAAPGS